MSKQPILVFDFDGVIVDGLIEYWNSSRKACLKLVGNEKYEEQLPLRAPDAFRKVRPWVKNGWEMVLLAAELLRTDSPIKHPAQFSNEYQNNCHKALKFWGWHPEQLQIALDNVRKQAIHENKEKWLESHHPFSGVVKRIQQLNNEKIEWAVLTTKSTEFTSQLLSYYKLSPTLLYGYERGSKPEVLLQISKEYLIQGFIEDRRATLETVLNTPSISWIPCYLANWGYLKNNDAQDLPIGIQLLKTEVFVSPIADWP